MKMAPRFYVIYEEMFKIAKREYPAFFLLKYWILLMVDFCNDANQVNFSGLVSSKEFYNKVHMSVCIRGNELWGVGYMDTSGKMDHQLH